ncbi:hypothetical protein QE152_g38611 [Popillia japonica]|uniref:Uncharacterized protein n=1 Tax=Popillia japonica TaxID=7064 RepID=A0AAW1HW03_POPJA
MLRRLKLKDSKRKEKEKNHAATMDAKENEERIENNSSRNTALEISHSLNEHKGQLPSNIFAALHTTQGVTNLPNSNFISSHYAVEELDNTWSSVVFKEMF